MSGISFSGEDEFRRITVANNLLKVLKSPDINLSPIVIDGGWGTGKTRFCEKLITLIKDDSDSKVTFNPVYIDAFQAEVANEPLVTLIASITKLFPDESKTKTNIKKAAIPVLKYGAKVALKASASWLLREGVDALAEGFSEAAQGAQESIGGEAEVCTIQSVATTADKISQKAIDSLLILHEQHQSHVKILSDLIDEATQEKPIVLVVDELDRCRPSFAMEVLESIKHIFSHQKLQIVLVTNLAQLKKSVSHYYGIDDDETHYLDKFTGYIIRIPETHTFQNDRKIPAAYTYYAALMSKDSCLANSYFNKGWLLGCSKELFELHGRSLRDIEKLIIALKIVCLFDTKQEDLSEILLQLSIAYLHCFNPLLLERVSKGSEGCADEAMKYFGRSSCEDLHFGRKADLLAIYFCSFLEGATKKNLPNKWIALLGDKGIYIEPHDFELHIERINGVLQFSI